MFEDGGATRNARGDIIKAASYQSRETPSARIEPNRKWFTNTRVISQDALAAFRGAVAETKNDPYSYLLKQNKLPMSLIKDNENTKNGIKQHQAKIAIETSPFADTFGPKAQRKRPKLAVASLEDFAGETDKMHDTYLDRLEQARLLSGTAGEGEQNIEANFPLADGQLNEAKEAIFSKGQSKRIWNELYKVIDSSDVIIHVLDARDPLGTRCRTVEKYIREEAPHKHLLFVLNKCDLIPTSVAVSTFTLLQTIPPPHSPYHPYLPGKLPSLSQDASLHLGAKSLWDSSVTTLAEQSRPRRCQPVMVCQQSACRFGLPHQGVERVSFELSPSPLVRVVFVEDLLVMIHTFHHFSHLLFSLHYAHLPSHMY